MIRFKQRNESFLKRATEIHAGKYDYSKVNYIDSQTKVIINCTKHGDFFQLANGHLSGKGCPVCSSSKGERFIRNVLLKHNIKHIQEYSIPLQSRRFRYDFYLPDYNLLIEFHGAQHYFPVKFFGGDDEFKKQNLGMV